MPFHSNAASLAARSSRSAELSGSTNAFTTSSTIASWRCAISSGETEGIDAAARLNAPEAFGEVVEGELAETRRPRLKARVDRRSLLEDHGRRVAMLREERQPAAKTALKHRLAMVVGEPDGALWLFEHPPDPGVKLLDDGQEDLFLAREMKVKRAARHLGASDDVTDGCGPVALAREGPGSRVEKLLPTSPRE